MTEESNFKILCPFCNKIWDAEMEDNLDFSTGCETCGYGSCFGSIEIKCTNCKKVIFTKEYDQ